MHIDKKSLAPEFGLMPDPAWGVVPATDLLVHPAPGTKPPQEVQHLHDPFFFGLLWNRLLRVIREPVKVHSLDDGGRLVEVLGDIVVTVAPNGQLSVEYWNWEGIGTVRLESKSARKVALLGLPSRKVWHVGLFHGISEEVKHWAVHRLQCGQEKAGKDLVFKYVRWLLDCFHRAMRRQCDLRWMRERIRQALALDARVLGLACRVPRELAESTTVLVDDYNKVLRNRQAFEALDREARHLLPVFAVFCESMGFPTDGEPLSRLKGYLRKQGLSERGWRMLVRSPRRILWLIYSVYRGPVHEAALDLILCLDALKLAAVPPKWLLWRVWTIWGGPNLRLASYLDSIRNSTLGLDHILAAFQRRYGLPKLPDNAMLDELNTVLCWDRAEATLHPNKTQRQAGWTWLLRRGELFARRRREAIERKGQSWSVPFDVATWEDWTVIPLADAMALFDEGVAMHHCAAKYAQDCEEGSTLILSIQKNDRRLYTLGLERKCGRLVYSQATGKANSVPSAAATKQLKALAKWIDHQEMGQVLSAAARVL